MKFTLEDMIRIDDDCDDDPFLLSSHLSLTYLFKSNRHSDQQEADKKISSHFWRD